MRRNDDASYFATRAREESKKAKDAMNRGAHPATAAAHGELAARYQAKAFVCQHMD